MSLYRTILTELKKLAQTCGFTDAKCLNMALRNQFVFGLESAAIRQRLLEMDGLKLEKAFEVARTS